MEDSFKTSVEDIIIDLNTCYDCDPCIHPIKIVFKDGSFYEKDWNEPLIHEILEYLGKEIPIHFKRYIKG